MRANYKMRTNDTTMNVSHRSPGRWLAIAAVFALLPGCLDAQAPGASKPVATGDKPSATESVAHDDAYIIGPSDVLAINVWKEPDISRSVPVRSESKSPRINILGQVGRPGAYPLTSSMTVLDAIATAGGFKDFAKQKSIYILRQKPDGTQVRLPFNYKDVIKGKNTEQNIKLEARDTVVVP